MSGEILVSSVIVVISLLLVATLSAIFLKKIKFPYTIGLVIIGIVIALIAENIQAATTANVHLTPELILYVLLPTLIFEASVNIDSRMLFRNIWPVLVLAAPGLVISTLIVGFFMGWATPLSLGAAMLFGALISATDPVAVIALFREMGAPKRLTLLVDGESLFNDATAIVMFNIVMAMITTGAVLSFGAVFKGSFDFLFVFFGGLVIGALIGYLMVAIVTFAQNDPMIEVALSTIVAYTAFIVADKGFGVSGVMSVMGAGMVVSWYGSTRFTPEVKQYMHEFWGFAAFAANSFIFLLLGLTEEKLILDILRSGRLIFHISLAIFACLVARAVIIFGITPIIEKFKGQKKISKAYQAVMFWGGLRGAVPLALVLSLPSHFEHRRLIIELTLGVVLFTLLVQGTTMRRLIHLLKLDEISLFDRFLSLQTRAYASKKGLDTVCHMENNGYFTGDTLREYKTAYEKQAKAARANLKELESKPENMEVMRMLIWEELLAIKRQTYKSFYDHGILSEPVMRELDYVCEVQMEAAKNDQLPPPPAIYSDPLEIKLQKFFFKPLKKLFPDSGIVKTHNLHMAANEFEENAAVIGAVNYMEKDFRNLEEFYDDFPDVISECRNFLKEIADIAQEGIDRLENTYGRSLRDIKRKLLGRITLDAELTALDELKDNGEIPESAVEQIQADIKKDLSLKKET